MVKHVKYETKRLGYILCINMIIWVNVLIGYFLVEGDITMVITLVKFIGILGVMLLLGRKFMAELVTRYFGKVIVTKK